jgi:ADP-ribose pyrophosphatase YjhB (NUDIX family)
MEKNKFEVILLGIIYNPEKKQILIGKGVLDPFSSKGWCFPGTKLKHGENLDKKLKEKIKEQTGYEVKNLGSIFVRTPQKEQEKFITYFLCEIFSGQEKAGNGLTELRWISPGKIEEYFTQNMNTRLKEFFENLK